MMTPFDPNELRDPRLKRAAGRFVDYCNEAFDWRRNADEPFDEASYEDARQMVLAEIQAMDKARVLIGGAA